MKRFLTILFPLLAVALACGDQVQDQQRTEERKAYKQHRSLIYGSGAYDTVDLDWLANDLVYQKGKVSLIIDTKDRFQGSVPAYLCNDSDQTLTNLVYELTFCIQEVKHEGHWKRTKPETPGCGTISPGRELPPGHALKLLVEDPSTGDATGEIRYFLFGGGPELSVSLQGRYDSKLFQEAEYDPQSVRWRQQLIPASKSATTLIAEPEDLVAALHLERVYHYSKPVREAALEELDLLDRQQGDRQQRRALRAVLEMPWNSSDDKKSLGERCLKALSTREIKSVDYGMPERRRALTWRYLTWRFHGENLNMNPDQRVRQKAIEQSGNPWGLSGSDAVELVKLATEDVRSKSPQIHAAAAEFLGSHWIKSNHLSDTELHKILGIERPLARAAAIQALCHRGLHNEAGKWILNRRQTLGSEAFTLLKRMRCRGPVSEWEASLLLILMEKEPQSTIESFEFRIADIRAKEAGGKLPESLRGAVKDYLLKEAHEQKLEAGKIPEKDRMGEWADLDETSNELQASYQSALRILDHWKNPEDNALFMDFLRHPFCRYQPVGDRIERRFGLRELAWSLLNERGVSPLPEVILKDFVTP